MASRAPIESYVAVTETPPLGSDAYVNEGPLALQEGRGSVFGGLLIGQAISAASATVNPDFYPYTSHSSFIRPVAQEMVTYRVERVSDGRSYATRIVRATTTTGNANDATLVYVATISFQSRKDPPSRTLDYAEAPPDLEGMVPDDIPEGSGKQQVDNYRSGSLQPFKPDDEPFDWRPVGLIFSDTPTESRVRAFSRSVAPLSSAASAVTNLEALAYMSDELLLGVAIFANPEEAGPKYRNVTMAATLNHHIWFHDSGFEVDRWMIVERSTSCGADGRVLVHQKVWDQESGRLVMTCTQEALIRLKRSNL